MEFGNEIIKIIEGGLDKNKDKVKSYSKLLMEKLQNEGDNRFAERIRKLLENKSAHPVYMDEFLSKPTDQDSQMDMIEITLPGSEKINLVLSDMTRRKIHSYIESVRNRSKLTALGIDLSEALLLYGPPGCGKTSIAHYIAQELNLPLVTGKLDSMVSSLLGSTAKNIRKIFDYAKERPCILFLDEFDAIAKARTDENEVGELKRVVNSLLQNIDNFTQNNLLICATNHEKLLDEAVWRRFSTIIEVPRPTEDTLVELVQLYLNNVKYDFQDDSKKIKKIALALRNLAPSDVKTVCYSAIKSSIISGSETVTYVDFLYQLYLFKNYKDDTVSPVQFLYQFGVKQNDIAKFLNISLRQIRNSLSQEEDVTDAE